MGEPRQQLSAAVALWLFAALISLHPSAVFPREDRAKASDRRSFVRWLSKFHIGSNGEYASEQAAPGAAATWPSRRRLADVESGKPVEWKPVGGKYLLALCTVGGLSRQVSFLPIFKAPLHRQLISADFSFFLPLFLRQRLSFARSHVLL